MLSSSSASPTGMKAASCHPLLPWHMMSRLGSSCPLPSQVRLLQPLAVEPHPCWNLCWECHLLPAEA